jgi:hypothetical protein
MKPGISSVEELEPQSKAAPDKNKDNDLKRADENKLPGP